MPSRKIALFIFLAASLAWSWPGQVLRQFKAPGSFCTTLAFDGQYLWSADYKTDMLYRIDPETGKKVSEIPAPGFWPTGLAYDGEHLWCADGKQKKIFQVRLASGAIVRAIDTPSDNPAGLAWDGFTLWVSDAQAKTIMKIDIQDGTAVKTFPAPAAAPQGLAWDGVYLWCADRLSDEIHMIDPASGEVIIILKAPGPHTRGVTFDGQYLWALDYQTDQIYQMVRQDAEPYRLENPRTCRVTYTHDAAVYGDGKLQDLNVYVAVPADLPQQGIFKTTFHPAPQQRFKDRWDQAVAHFKYSNKPSGSHLTTTMEIEARISEINYFIFPDRCGTLADIPAAIRETYTANGSKYMIDDPYIMELSRKIVGSETNPYWMARKIFDHVRNTLEYKHEGGWNTAPVVLQRGTGSCSEYTFSFIALCRAAGIPARYEGGLVVRGDDASFDDMFHRWPQVYLPNYGWIPMDPQGGDKPGPRDRAMNIGHLPNRFLILTQGGGDSAFLGWYYYSWENYVADAKVKVEIDNFAEWEPLSR